MRTGITVAIPSIPPRAHLLGRALGSVLRQTHPATAIHVEIDHHHEGAAVTRQRALDAVDTEYVAYLDDDDILKPKHLERLMTTMTATGADYVYPWFDMAGGVDPFPQHFGKPFNPADPVQTTITVLVRTELAKAAGFLRPSPDDTVGGQVWGEDYQHLLEIVRLGGKVVHLPERTWTWSHHQANSSGRGDRW